MPPEVWPEKLKSVWKVEVGEGYATPLVAGDRIFQPKPEANQRTASATSATASQTS